ncbi:hypothetical protein [Neomoorella mulderi]|uniref:Tetrahydromethanopterin S-methyltransferase subunit H n=1 Tax=Moorella mulderi DSM 14980 TaxID=1122241 RepID=A0A151AWH9_9FIRM|nr:hypothetical protein [Moorella mulderi]KYH31912.1 tetrahydromethanopterin S-methyltransferase subunit H [Moorella mulderi DSM 14980]
MIKEEKLGYPAGCSPSNAFHTWQKSRLQEERAMVAAGVAVYTLSLVYGADFIFYGPIRHSPWVYPACATASAIIAYGARLGGVRPVKNTPCIKFFNGICNPSSAPCEQPKNNFYRVQKEIKVERIF